jgi:hypothetical protein
MKIIKHKSLDIKIEDIIEALETPNPSAKLKGATLDIGLGKIVIMPANETNVSCFTEDYGDDYEVIFHEEDGEEEEEEQCADILVGFPNVTMDYISGQERGIIIDDNGNLTLANWRGFLLDQNAMIHEKEVSNVWKNLPTIYRTWDQNADAINLSILGCEDEDEMHHIWKLWCSLEQEIIAGKFYTIDKDGDELIFIAPEWE